MASLCRKQSTPLVPDFPMSCLQSLAGQPLSLQNPNPRCLFPSLLPLRRHSSNDPTTQSSPPREDDLPVLIADAVLRHSGDDDPQTLARSLSRLSPSAFPPALVDRVMKRLWNDAPRALLFFHSLLHLPSSRPAASSFDLAIDLAGRLRDPRALHGLLSLRRRHGLPPTPRTFAIIAERHLAAGKPDRAVRSFLSMPRLGCPHDLAAFNSLLDALCKSRRVEKASSLLRALKNRFLPDAITYNIIADGWCRLKRTPKALEVLREMVDSGLEPTLNTYNILLKGFFRAGQIKEALAFFSQMKKRGRKENSNSGANCRPDVVSYTTMVHGLGLAGRLHKARKVFDEMVGEGCLPSVATYNALIQVICKKGCVKDAVLVFDEMVRKGYTPNAITYNLVIRGLCHAEEMDQAMEFLERMKREECEPNVQTYNILIRYWCEEGEIEKGLELFGRMAERGGCLPNLDTYNVLISAMFSRKRPEDMVVAGKMVMEMVERGHLPRRFMFNRVLNGLLLTGNQGFARELLRMQDRHKRLARVIRP
ncbi:pentatricopeptide repeat-containing protein At1g74900, mitochondrial [Phoenix dactylifera]|uniref:Pentatricopeptide repeat-containing protein At1g74900, mitochondrial n=1 Tax=Phoenix dactylifera TaxID=42345 RepID=A0A8B7C2R5_PHODC|nr:pentatricopeptide repeat-containing protein At1g74900, mitochondrial [Phoenix dactylifera]